MTRLALTHTSNERDTREAVLLVAAPLTAVRDWVLSESKRFAEWNPHGEHSLILKKVHARLEVAIRAARDVNVWMSVEEIASMTRKRRSTISRICRAHGEKVGASKVGGSWTIYWPAFEAYLHSGDNQIPNEEAL